MDVMRIVGSRNVTFKDDSGKEITGRSFFYTMEDKRVEGLMAGRFFIRAADFDELETIPVVGSLMDVTYNRFGRPSNFKLIK